MRAAENLGRFKVPSVDQGGICHRRLIRAELLGMSRHGEPVRKRHAMHSKMRLWSHQDDPDDLKGRQHRRENLPQLITDHIAPKHALHHEPPHTRSLAETP